MALGAGDDRRNDNIDILLSFLGILGWQGSAVAWDMRLFKPMGGGAAESKDEARDEAGPSCETGFSSPSSVARKEAGPALGPS